MAQKASVELSLLDELYLRLPVTQGQIRGVAYQMGLSPDLVRIMLDRLVDEGIAFRNRTPGSYPSYIEVLDPINEQEIEWPRTLSAFQQALNSTGQAPEPLTTIG